MYKVSFSKIIKVLLKLGNNVHAFYKFAPFLGYLEIKKGYRYTKTYILHTWGINRNFSPTGS